MRASKEVSVGGYTYALQQLPASIALKLFHRLARGAGPAISKLAEAVSGVADPSEITLANFNVAALGGAFESVFDKLSADDMMGIVKELLTDARIVEGEDVTDPNIGKREVFDLHFAGRLEDVFTLAKEALRVNYGNFFGKLLATVPRRKAQTSSSTSTSPQA